MQSVPIVNQFVSTIDWLYDPRSKVIMGNDWLTQTGRFGCLERSVLSTKLTCVQSILFVGSEKWCLKIFLFRIAFIWINNTLYVKVLQRYGVVSIMKWGESGSSYLSSMEKTHGRRGDFNWYCLYASFIVYSCLRERDA